uniref:Phosphotransferase n=1 Tax=Ciona savignyi TaxID=51511 RepID=H2YR53_CIOSA
VVVIGICSIFIKMGSYQPYLQSLKELLHVTDAQLTTVSDRMLQDMTYGLQLSRKSKTQMEMLPSFVDSLPDGSERGAFIGLDLGGTNLRVLLLTLSDPVDNGSKPVADIKSESFKVTKDLLEGTSAQLFDFIAEKMASFAHKNGLVGKKLPVGFTFSFPFDQDRINHAILKAWTKAYHIKDGVGDDVVQMLHDAIARQGDLNCEVVAVCNDTVGTLVSGVAEDQNCQIGLIVGTGTNAAYLEKVSNIESVESQGADRWMCVDMEWEYFADTGCLDQFLTEFDKQVDASSPMPGQFIFEKMISGMYMGEIVRSILCKLAKVDNLFAGNISETLATTDAFLSRYVSDITEEAIAEHGKTEVVTKILSSVGVTPSSEDVVIVQLVCEFVSTRAAHLCAAGVSAIARKIKANHPDENDLVITAGVDGSVYAGHPTFDTMLEDKTAQLCSAHGVKVQFIHAKDGSGKGAALIAA